MNGAETERRVRALAAAADLPEGFDMWSAVLARQSQLRRRRVAARIAVAAAAALAIATAVAVPLMTGAPASAAALARQAARVASTGAGLPPFELTDVIATAPVGFQPEPPPPLVTEHIEYAGPAHWRDESVITEPFGEGVQRITRIRNGPLIANVVAGQVTITRAAAGGELPFSASVAWPRAVLHDLLAAGSAGRCAPSASLAGNGPSIDGRPTVVLRIGPSPCPSADFPQANGPATYWLDQQTLLVLRAQLHGPGNRLDVTITVTRLRYHVSFAAGNFRIPRPTPAPRRCRTVMSLPDVAALRRVLAYPPLLPSRLPGGLRTGAIDTDGSATGGCKITIFTVTYQDRSGRPAVQLYEAPQASPSVRFPGSAVVIRPGLTGTLNSGSGMAILWWIQDGRYCALQSGGLTAGVRLTGVPVAVLIRMAASLQG